MFELVKSLLKTVQKNNCNKVALGEITIGKYTRLKFLEIDFTFTISGIIVLYVKVVFILCVVAFAKEISTAKLLFNSVKPTIY
jgi:hypothetical protein